MNIGFKEAQKLQKKYECFIFHDVDLLPENDGNPYTCPEDGKPRQMSYSIDHSDYSNISYKYVLLTYWHSKIQILKILLDSPNFYKINTPP